jgi:hypothetical protein
MRHVRVLALALVFIVALPSAGMAAIRITKIVYDPPGPDYRTKRQLRREYVVIHNTSGKGKQLRGWVLRDRAGHRFTFPSYRIGPNGYVRCTLARAVTVGATSTGIQATSSGTTMGTRLGLRREVGQRPTHAAIQAAQAPTRPSAVDGPIPSRLALHHRAPHGRRERGEEGRLGDASEDVLRASSPAVAFDACSVEPVRSGLG